MSHKKSTFLILTPGFAADETDSTCLPFHQTFVKALKENFPGLTIIILAFHYPFHRASYQWQGVEVIPFNGYKKGPLLKLVLWRRILKVLKNIQAQNKLIGMLSFWCGECAWIGKKFSRKHDVPHYCWLQGQDARKGNKYVKRIHPASNELVALSDFLQSEFEKNYSIRPDHVISPGVDPRQFPVNPLKKDIDILGAGSLIPLKQFNLFLDIISEIKKYIPGIKAVLCGKGPETENLRAQIDRLQLHENVNLTGEIPHADVLKFMQRSKLFLHPSSYEGFGVVCLEALFAGTHVISFCRIMNEEIRHWHITGSKEAMQQKTLELLQRSPTEYDPVLPYRVDNTIKKVMHLYGL